MDNRIATTIDVAIVVLGLGSAGDVGRKSQ
jgi:hypothetical protein